MTLLLLTAVVLIAVHLAGSVVSGAYLLALAWPEVGPLGAILWGQLWDGDLIEWLFPDPARSPPRT